MAAQEFKCPKCKQIDKVQKVSALYSGGISTAEYEVWVPPPPKSDLPPLRRTQVAVSQTALSQRLSPPAKPANKFPHWIWVLLGVVGAPIVCCSTVETPEEGGLYYFLVIGGIVLAVVFAVYSARQQKVNEEMPKWESAIRRWNQLYYCSRCDGVFIPEKTLLVPSEMTRGFLRLGSELESRMREATKPPQSEDERKEVEEIADELKELGWSIEDVLWMQASQHAVEYQEKS